MSHFAIANRDSRASHQSPGNEQGACLTLLSQSETRVLRTIEIENDEYRHVNMSNSSFSISALLIASRKKGSRFRDSPDRILFSRLRF